MSAQRSSPSQTLVRGGISASGKKQDGIKHGCITNAVQSNPIQDMRWDLKNSFKRTVSSIQKLMISVEIVVVGKQKSRLFP